MDHLIKYLFKCIFQFFFFRFPDGQHLHKDALENMRIFDKKYKEGVIDVWWLYDDGG